MEHAREIDLIELAAQRLNGERRQTLLLHLEDCPTCRMRLDSIVRTWDILGAWEVEPAGQVNVVGLEASSGPQGTDRRTQFLIRFPDLGTTVRIAAAIAVTALAGYAGGRWSVRPANTVSGDQPPQYVSVLGLEIGESLSAIVLDEGTSSEQEGQS